MRPRALAMALALLLAAPPPAAATTYVALSPQEVMALADAVFTATVADVTARVDGDDVWTVVTLSVEEWLTDDPESGADEAPRSEVVLELLGGEAEGRRLIVSGSPTWRPGEAVLVAAHADAGLASPLVGFRQGLWRSQDGGLVDEDGRFLGLDAGGALARTDRPEAPTAVVDAVRATLAGEAPEPVDDPEDADEPASPAAPEGPGPPEEPDEPEGPDAPGDEEPAGEPGAAGEEPGERADEDAGAAVAPIDLPDEPVAARYAVDDAGGPLLLSERVAAAAAAWAELAPGDIELLPDPGADHGFAYGAEELFGPGVITLSLARPGAVRVLVRPDEHPALDAALRHEVGALLGLPPAASGVMAMAVADPDAAPGPADLAELAAIHAFEPADLDRDGTVGFGDLLVMAAEYGRSGVNLPADLDGDGDVDDDDLAQLRRAYTFAPPAGAEAVEGVEPAAPGDEAEPGPGDPETEVPDEPEGPSAPDEPEDPDGP